MSMTTRLARKLPMSLAMAGVMVLGAGGTAHAATGGGTYTDGYEIPSAKVTLATGPQCAKFHKTNTDNSPATDDPTTHVLPMSGDFGSTSNSGSGTATFKISTDWFAGPNGTYTNLQCDTAGSWSGSLVIDFEDYSCTGTGTYQRTNMTTYSLISSNLTCDLVSTTGTTEAIPVSVTFTGTQVLCGNTGQPACNDPDAGTNLNGSYTWSA